MADLQRIARLVAWFCFGVLLAWVWMVPAYAETIPATNGSGTVPPVNYACYSGMPPADKRTNQAAAEYWCLQYVVGESNAALRTRDSRESRSYGYMLNWKYTSGASGTAGVGMSYNCAAGQTKAYVATGDQFCVASSGVYSCPATGGWTLSGSNCTRPDCPAGQIRDASGACVNDCEVGAAGETSFYTGQFSGCGADAVGKCSKPSVGPYSPPPSTGCDGTCVVSATTRTSCSSEVGLPGAPVSCHYSGTKTGASCSGGNGPAPTYDPCFGEGKVAGTISGVPVCAGEAPKSTESTKTTTTPTSTTTTTTNTYCDGAGACSTTTTSTYTSGGSGPNGTGPGSTTVPGTGPGTAGEGKPAETEKQEKSSFCEENPDSPICKSTAFSGACTASAPACDGDAVQCAQAAEAWKINCAIRTEPTDAAYTLGKSIAAGGADPVKSPLDPSLLDTVNVESIVTGAGAVRTLTGACIPPQTFTVQGHSYTFDTTLFCQFATIIGYLMVAASSVIAIRMVVSGGSV